MGKLTAKKPAELEFILSNLKDYFYRHWDEIKSVRVIQRCDNCFKKNLDVSVIKRENELFIKNWIYNCNNDKEQFYEFSIPNFDHKQSFFHIEKNTHGFQLKMDFYMGTTLSIPLSPFYPLSDYEVGGYKVYQDKNLSLLERNTKNHKIIMLQQFIDFFGLSPMYSFSIQLSFK